MPSNIADAATAIHVLVSIETIDDIERMAIDDAGSEFGKYLESLGRTDMVTLSEDEFRESLKRVVVGFLTSFKSRLALYGQYPVEPS